MLKDIEKNHRLKVFTRGEPLQDDHPLAEKIPDGETTYNNLFRGVHDFFGHIAHGNPITFPGEFHAFLTHKQMYTPEAQGAMTWETLANTQWFQYIGKGKTFAPQKANIYVFEEDNGKQESNVTGLYCYNHNKEFVDHTDEEQAEDDKLPKEPYSQEPDWRKLYTEEVNRCKGCKRGEHCFKSDPDCECGCERFQPDYDRRPSMIETYQKDEADWADLYKETEKIGADIENLVKDIAATMP